MTKTNSMYTLERQINKLNGEIIQTKTNHIFHLLCAVLTFGLWVPFWFLIGCSNAIERRKLKRRQNRLELQLNLLLEGV